MVNGMIETASKGEVSEASWKMIDWLVEYTFLNSSSLMLGGRLSTGWLNSIPNER